MTDYRGTWPASLGQNRFDVLAKTLQPYTALFFNKSTNRGVETDITLRQDSSNNRLLLNRSAHVFFQPPDKLRVEVSGFDPKVVFCRNGQSIWVSPKSFGEALLAGLPSSSSTKSVPEFRLPLKETEIMLLPALLQIYASRRTLMHRTSRFVLRFGLIHNWSKGSWLPNGTPH